MRVARHRDADRGRTASGRAARLTIAFDLVVVPLRFFARAAGVHRAPAAVVAPALVEEDPAAAVAAALPQRREAIGRRQLRRRPRPQPVDRAEVFAAVAELPGERTGWPGRKLDAAH